MFRDVEDVADEFGAVAKVLLDEFGADDAEEGCGGLVCDGFGEEGFSCSGGAIEDYPLGWTDAHFFVELRMGQGEFDGFLKLELWMERSGKKGCGGEVL